jgi:VIT1/CCC1 family predicted Fe2+/Mn2+ transporter
VSLEKTESLLRKFDYTYEKTNDHIEVRLGHGLRVTANFSNSEKVVIKESLTTWNFLTGTLDMSLKSAIMYNFIGSFILIGVFFFGFDQEDYITPTLIFLAMIFIVLLWSNYYLTKAEHMKHTLRRWNEN